VANRPVLDAAVRSHSKDEIGNEGTGGQTPQAGRSESDQKPRHGCGLREDEEETEPSRKAEMLEFLLEPVVGYGVIENGNH
jgi:hypothetical protein